MNMELFSNTFLQYFCRDLNNANLVCRNENKKDFEMLKLLNFERKMK